MRGRGLASGCEQFPGNIRPSAGTSVLFMFPYAAGSQAVHVVYCSIVMETLNYKLNVSGIYVADVLKVYRTVSFVNHLMYLL